MIDYYFHYYSKNINENEYVWARNVLKSGFKISFKNKNQEKYTCCQGLNSIFTDGAS